jgi:hypothetical protein
LLTGAALTISHRIAAGAATVLLCSRSIAVGCSAAMLRVVLPATVTASSTASSWLGRNTVTPTYVRTITTIHVRIAVVIVIVVDRDVVIATPTAAPTPASAHCRSHGYSNSEGDRHPGRVVSGWRIGDWGIRVGGCAVHDGRVVAWNVHNLRIRLFDDDDLLGFHNFRFYLLLLIRFQIARALSFFAHALHSVHDIILLPQKCVA